MAKVKNLVMQMNTKFNNIVKIGSSKTDCREGARARSRAAGNEPTREHASYVNQTNSPFVHSCSTATGYRKIYGEFGKWLKGEKTELWNSKDLNNITKETCYDYLHERTTNGCSASTVRTNMCALNKLFNFGLSKEEGHLPEKSYHDTTRSRVETKSDHEYNPKNSSEQIDIANAFGLRRGNICSDTKTYPIKESSLFRDGGRVYCSIIGKNGKYNEVPCLKSFQPIIQERYNIVERHSNILETKKQEEDERNRERFNIKIEYTLTKGEFISNYNKTSDDRLFIKYPKCIDNHAFRRTYAQELYRELANQKIENGEVTLHNCYKIYDREILTMVSHAISHNRLSVSHESYLSK